MGDPGLPQLCMPELRVVQNRSEMEFNFEVIFHHAVGDIDPVAQAVLPGRAGVASCFWGGGANKHGLPIYLISGRIPDAASEQVARVIAEGVADAIREELDRRRGGGGPQMAPPDISVRPG